MLRNPQWPQWALIAAAALAAMPISCAHAQSSTGRLQVRGLVLMPTTAIGSSNSRSLLITNLGNGRLRGSVGSMTAPFTVTSGGGSFDLEPRGVRTVVIRFAPHAAGVLRGELAITSDDPKKPVVKVAIRGAGKKAGQEPAPTPTPTPTPAPTPTPTPTPTPAPVPTPTHEWFVAPGGSATGHGTMASPWNLQTALAGGPSGTSVRPGHIIWVRGGTYAGSFRCALTGSEQAPIIVRNYARERVILDNAMANNSSLHLPTNCRNVWVWGLELVDSDPTRVTDTGGNRPPIHRGGSFDPIDVQGPGVKVINCVVRDGANGIGVWNNGSSWGRAKSAEVYGCLVFNNGWHAPTRGSGHGIYAQNTNSAGTPSLLQIRDTMIWNNFGYGLHAYSEDSGTVSNMLFDGVISFNNGSPTAAFRNNSRRDPNILARSTQGTHGVTIRGCFMYHPTNADGTNLWAGEAGKSNTGLVFENSFLGGASMGAMLEGWQSIQATGNRFMSRGADAKFVQIETNTGQVPSGYRWNNNIYQDATPPAGNGGRYTFSCDGVQDQSPGGGMDSDLRFSAWRSGTGFDSAATYTPGGTPALQVAVRPNLYEKGRANIVVYNWERHPAVGIDLSTSGLANGQAFEIRNVQNYFGPPLVTGTFNSGSPVVTLPMTDSSVMSPVGFDRYPIASTLPEFGAFVLLPK